MKKEPKFLVAENLARLAKWLRLLGYDTELYKAVGLNTKIRIARRDGRTYLTRSWKEAGSNLAYSRRLINSDDHLEQLRELSDLIEIDTGKLFSRCSVCNSSLYEVNKDKIRELVPDYVYENHDVFRICRKCGKIYWKGTHFQEIRKVLEEILEQ